MELCCVTLQHDQIQYKSLPLSLDLSEACLTSFIACCLVLCHITPHCCSVIESETALSVQENDTSPTTLTHHVPHPVLLLEPYENPHHHHHHLHGRHSFLNVCLAHLMNINIWLMILLRHLGFGVPPPSRQEIRSNHTLGKDYFKACL